MLKNVLVKTILLILIVLFLSSCTLPIPTGAGTPYNSFKGGLIKVNTVATLSTEVPDRVDGVVCITEKNKFTICAYPENFVAKGYFPNEDGTFSQKGRMEYYVIPAKQLQKKQYDISELEFSILSKNPELYEIVDMYIEPLRNVTEIILTTTLIEGDTFANYTDYNINYTDDDGNNGTINISHYPPKQIGNTTWYYVYRNTTKIVRENLIEWDLESNIKLIFEVTVPYPSSDVFDIEGCFNGLCRILPAPIFSTTTQTNWDLGTYNNTGSNSSGVITLDYTYDVLNLGVDTTKLILFYKFDNRSELGENDSIVYDHSGHGRNGTPVGTKVKAVSAGKINGAYNFTNSDIRTVSEDPFYGNNHTITAWVKWRAFNTEGGSNSPDIVGRQDVSTNKQLEYGTDVNGKMSMVNNGPACSNTGTAMIGGTTLSVDTWYFVTYRFIINKNQSMFLNGQHEKSQTNNLVMGNCVQKTYIGGRGRSSGRNLDGYIDELAIWNRSLTDAEINTVYETTKGNYPASGTYLSKIINSTFDSATWQNISVANSTNNGDSDWTLLIRSCDDDACSGESFTDVTGNSPINLATTDNPYFQYKILPSTTNTTKTPIFYNVTVGYDQAVAGGTVVNDTNVTLYSSTGMTLDHTSNYNVTANALFSLVCEVDTNFAGDVNVTMSNSSHIVPVGSGIPFYTTNATNPLQNTFAANTPLNITFQFNASGAIGITNELFCYTNTTLNLSQTSGNSNLFNITIVAPGVDDCTTIKDTLNGAINDGTVYTLTSDCDIRPDILRINNGGLIMNSGIFSAAGCYTRDSEQLFSKDGSGIYCSD